MYKLLFFIHKPVDDKILDHFRNHTLEIISELTNQPVKLGGVESNLLTKQKYSYLCEAVFGSKDEMENAMNSKSGLALNKDLMDFHQYITVISVNYKL